MMAVHPNPNLPGGGRVTSAPAPEGGPDVGSSPVHVRAQRPAVLIAAGFAVLVGGGLWLGHRITSVLIAAAPDQSEQGVESLLIGLVVVGMLIAFVLPLLFRSADAEEDEDQD